MQRIEEDNETTVLALGKAAVARCPDAVANPTALLQRPEELAAAVGAFLPCGLLLIPGNANPQLPLEPAHEWHKEFSNSQQKEYWFNARTKQSVWDALRKTRPISFRSCAAAMVKWDKRNPALTEETLLEMAEDIVAPGVVR